MFADRYGTRITLAISAVLWGVCTIATGLIPASLATGAAFACLWLARFLLGSAEATTYPVGALAVHNWIVPSERAFANSCMFAGTSLAAAFASPFVSWLMLRVGWRNVFLITSLPAFAAAFAWWLFSANTPALHRSINPAELALANSQADKPQAAFNFLVLLRNPKIVLLCLSYVAEGYLLFLYVFWLYIYLVEVRGFTMMRGGLVASLPWLAGLALTPLGGLAADRIASRRGRLPAAKYVVMVGYSLSGALLFLAAFAQDRWVCIAALSLSVGFLMASEASFWVSATYLAGSNAGAVSGLMNTAGILGGIASTSLIPLLVARFNWPIAFASGTVVALACVLIWIWIAQPPQDVPNLLDVQQEQS